MVIQFYSLEKWKNISKPILLTAKLMVMIKKTSIV